MKDIAWSELSFGYMPTDYNVRCCYRNGKWGEVEVAPTSTLSFTWQPPVCITDRKPLRD